MTDEAGTPLPGAEVIVTGSELVTRTGSDGRFRIQPVVRGKWEILIRAIGYAPHYETVSVLDQDYDVGTVPLQPSPVILPDVTTSGKVAIPRLGLSFAIDMERGCRQCGRNGRYLPTGASVTSDGLALTVYQPLGWRLPLVLVREHPVGIGLAGRWVFGSYGCNDHEPPIATRISESGTTGGLLYQSGEAWLIGFRGRCNGVRRNLQKTGNLVAATGMAWGWAAVVEEKGRSFVQEFDDYGLPQWSVPLSHVFGPPVDPRQLILAPFGEAVTVALTVPPFSWVVLDSTGAVALRSSPTISAPQIDSLVGDGSFRNARGYAVLPIRNGFVQTIETLDRKRGVFVLYDVIGRPVSVQKRGPPAVLIASAFDPPVVLGYQYVHPNGSSKLLLVRY